MEPGTAVGDPAARQADAATSGTRAAAGSRAACAHQGFPRLSPSSENAAPERALTRGEGPAVSVLPARGPGRPVQVRGAEGRGRDARFSRLARQLRASPGPGDAASPEPRAVGVFAPARREASGQESYEALGNGLLQWLLR